MNRREVIQAAGAAVALSTCHSILAEEKPPPLRKTIAMLVYPEFTALDLVGPHHVFSLLEGYQVQLVWRSLDSVTSDTRMTIKPTMTFEECPADPAVLFVPGGTTGTLKMMQDDDVLAFLGSRAKAAEYVTSVCTGSLVLGAAGLLRGYKATTHWGARDVLKTLGSQPVDERVVWDRNRVTGGGVTAGIDFGLSLAARLKGEVYAKGVQLMMEYSPSPPFQSGTPSEAGSDLTAQLKAMFAPFVNSATSAAEKVRSRW